MLRLATDPDDVGARTQFVEEAHVAQFGFQVGAVAHAAHDGHRDLQAVDEPGEQAVEGDRLVKRKLRLQGRLT